jgi:hypothetical protein
MIKNGGRRADRVAQLVEWLLSKCKALSSNTSTEKKKKMGPRALCRPEGAVGVSFPDLKGEKCDATERIPCHK